MTHTLFVVDNPSRWSLEIPGVTLISSRQYISDPELAALRHCKVFNLCRSYRYQKTGYYVSLLAEARGHKPMPRISTIEDLKSQSLIRVVTDDLDEHIQKSLHHLVADTFTLSIYFARNPVRRYDRLCRQLFNLFPSPLLRATFRREDTRWELTNISPISIGEVPDEHRPSLIELAREYFANRPATISRKRPPRFYIGILTDPQDPTPPSDDKAIRKFMKAAETLGMSAELISKNDYGQLAEFDGLFIRTTTSVNSYTYRFARKAEAERLAVIDDPQSIVRCTNKVFLAELLEHHEIRAPKTVIVHKDNIDAIHQLGFPCVLKQPDSSFSQGVIKAKDEPECREKLAQLFEKSDLVIAQEFLPTDFDWRIGILDGKPLYACKYFMARGHWQIYHHGQKGDRTNGRSLTMPVELAPRHIVKTALKAANLIGNGLYGVDLKEFKGQSYVIEVNDNPSIESGVEDEILRETLYLRIMEVFLRRMEQYSGAQQYT